MDCGSGVTEGVVSGSGWTDVSDRFSQSLQCEMREKSCYVNGTEGIFWVHYKLISTDIICNKLIFAKSHVFFTKKAKSELQ